MLMFELICVKVAQPVPGWLINRDNWKKRLDGVEIGEEDMKVIVMNFLVVEGYVEVAETFRLATGTNPDIDIGRVADRMAVKTALQNGDVQAAIEKLNDMDPEILGTNRQLFFRVQLQRLIELIRNRNTEEALACAKEVLAPIAEEHRNFLPVLEKTVALLAFEDPSNCPFEGEVLDISLRSSIATIVNAAILKSQNLDKVSALQYLVKMWIWAQTNCELEDSDI
ncbi:protein GID8 homolog isoform X2 [Lotus japonicus]|uniref:protein GID8 homolog isoform X2 n=1 Tax=Lotus japonicus TaxID=34305 RepID=UPI002582565A|nr:protein GID8 homolog isoform X2 [Lotus japonicus]